MIHILYDTPGGYPFIAELLDREHIRHDTPAKSSDILSWLAGSWNAVQKSRRGDTIVTLYDFQGVLCYWIARLCLKQRKVIAVNILLKHKDTLRNRLATYLYRKALGSPDFTATVTTESYGRWLSGKLGLKKPLILLRDVYYDSYGDVATKTGTSDGGYVFCGGRNGRDWSFIHRLAEAMPGTRFHFVMPSQVFDTFDRKLPNVTYHCNIPVESFNRLLAGASIVALPLDTDAPAGLIVVFQAAAHAKPIVITDTISTHDYISDNKGYGLPNDINLWRDTISSIMADPVEPAERVRNLKSFITQNCSQQKYVDSLREIIDKTNI